MTALIRPPDDWMTQGLCAQVDPELWFPEKGGSVRAAKRICNGDAWTDPCPVRDQCLAHALSNHERFGIWGGLSERERTQLRSPIADEYECQNPVCGETFVPDNPHAHPKYCSDECALDAKRAQQRNYQARKAIAA